MLLRFFSNVMTKALSLLLQCLVNEMRSQTTARKGQAIIYQMKKTPILEHATSDFLSSFSNLQCRHRLCSLSIYPSLTI